jgi:transposase InsO family protein
MLGGIAALIALGLDSKTLAEYGFPKLAEAVVRGLIAKGESRESMRLKLDGTFRMTLNQQHIKHRFTRPNTPPTNEKPNASSRLRSANGPTPAPTTTPQNEKLQLDPWLHDYNFHRPHTSLNLNTPASRSGLNRNNLLSLHI